MSSCGVTPLQIALSYNLEVIYIFLLIYSNLFNIVKHFIINQFNQNFNNKKGSLCKIKRARVSNLSNLYAYCPIYEGAYGLKPVDYPCCDSSALRPEHRQQATIFTFGNGQFHVNPQYAHLFTAK